MEGGGEGLVAIVQGLNPAGVTLTVCNRPRHDAVRRRSSRPRIQVNAGNTMLATDQRSHTSPENPAPPANQRSSVQTSTAADFSRQNTSSQICDGRYASSYRMAHCMVTPTSPPEAVSEFPPQRKEPCRNQGNFEIGGQGSGQWNCHGSGQGSGHSSGNVRISASRVRHYGGSQTWVEKASCHRYCKSSRDTEAFAHSLRKYPSMAPFRTASTDLIEKLIRYTQAKNFQEMSRSSKSMRSLRQQKSSDTHEMAKASKHQQTYIRARQDDNVINNNSKVQVGSRGRTRNFKLYSPMSNSRNLKETRHRETAFTSSYDYLKAANSSYRRSNHSDECPSPAGSSSPERSRTPEKARSPEVCKSPEVSRSPVRFKSTDGFRSPYRPNHSDRSIRFERSVRDSSLSDMSKYIRSTIRQICNERPVVFQVCPKLKSRFNQHKKVCPHRNDRASDIMEDEPEEDQASSSALSRLIQSFTKYAIPSTEQSGCQCNRTDCHCTKATQCVNNPDAATNTTTCSCRTTTRTGCCRGMPCVCANKSQEQVYYNKRIDEEISEWLKDVPVNSVECSNTKKKRETVVKKLRKTLKQLPDDENFDDNVRNEIKSFVDDFPLWNPGKDKKHEKLFKNQLADKLTERIVGIPRKPDRFRDIVKKWIVKMDFEEDDDEDVEKEIIIDKFVDKLKSLAAERPACDIKYTNTLRKEIIELLVELALKFDGDMIMLKNIANKLATEIVSIPRNVNLSGNTTDLTDEFEDNVSDWICEHGLCRELNKDPKLIEDLAKKLKKLKSQGIDDECVVEKMKEEVRQFVDDVSIAIDTMDELVDELTKELSASMEMNEMERQRQQNNMNNDEMMGQDELTEELRDWLSNLPGASDLHPRKFENIIKELVNVIKEGIEQGNEDLTNDILNCLVDADLPIDPDDLSTHVEELMEKLNILPSEKYRKEQAKKAMLKEIFDVIENMSISEDKKAELRKKAYKIVEKQLNESSLIPKEAHDDVEETSIDNMDVFISSFDIPKDSLVKLKSSLSNTLSNVFNESLTGIRRLNKDVSHLKQRISKDVRNAFMELPINTDKKEKLIQQVLSKNMHKPLPSNVKNTINNEISDTVDRCPISEDNSIVGCLKKILSAVASKHLNICLPKCVCDIQSKVEKDVGIVIDRSSIDTGEQKKLKKRIRDILTENEDSHLSDEVLRTIKKDINGVVSDLSIPQDKKDVLKKIVGETISKDFNEALSNLRHDLNKKRNKLFEDICNVIEKSPIPGVVKTRLINKLQSVLARNLDSSLSDEEKNTILIEVKDDMPEEKRRSLTNKQAKKLDTQQRKQDTNKIDQLTENLKELEKKILDYIFREMEQAVEEAPIPRETKIELKKQLKDIATIDYKKPAEYIAEALMAGINEILNELHLPKDKKNYLKNELAAAIDEYSKLLRKIQKLECEYGKHKKPIEEFDENKVKENILQGIEEIIEESAIPEEKKMKLKRKLKNMATDNLKKPFSEDVQDAIKIGIADILDKLEIPKTEKDNLKRALINMTGDYLENFREEKQPVEEVDANKAKESILQGIEKIIKESAIPEDKKMELKKKLKKMTTDNLKKPFSEDVQDAIKIGITDILDELEIPKTEKDKLKRALINMTDDYLENFREEKPPVEEIDGKKAKESILQGIENIIEKSAIPEEKKVGLKRKLNKMVVDNLKKPLSNDVQDAIKIGIADILDELQIPKSEKDRLKRALINVAEENLDNLRDDDKTKAKESILQGIDKIITESAIPEEKKMEMTKNLKKMATDNLKEPFSDDVQDAMKISIADTLDKHQIPKSGKEKLKRALINMADETLAKLREAKQPLEEVDETKARRSILQGIENICEKSAIPEEKKMKLKRNLKKMVVDNLKKPFSNDVQDAIKIGISDILDELQIPKSEKDKLKRALINMTDDYLENFREEKQPVEEVDGNKAKESILQGIEKIIKKSAISEDKKMELKKKLKKMATDNLKMPFSSDVQDAIKIGIADILDELQIPKSEKDKLKRALINMAEENLDNLRDVDKTKAKESILQGIERIITESAIPEEKKMEMTKNLKKMATDNLKEPFSDDVQDAMKISIADTLDKQQIPKSGKEKLKRALINMADETLAKLREAKQPLEEVDETKARRSILQGIENICEKSAIPEEKKMKLKRNLKKMVVDNLKKPFNNDVQDAIKIGIADILDELQIPKSEKDKLKRALINMTDDYLENFREEKQPVEEVEGNKAKESILQGIENICEKSAIPEEKKMKLKRKLKKIVVDNLKKPFSNDVQDAIKIGIADILDELQIPKSEKDKLKRALINMTDDYLENFREEKQPVEEVNGNKAKESILQGIEKIIKESAIPEDKKMELKKKLKKMATDNLKKPFSEDVQDAIKIGIADILDELEIPKTEKDKLKLALINMTDDYLENFMEEKPPIEEIDGNKAKESILQGIENIIEESAIPEEKKVGLKRKLKKMVFDNLKKPFSNDVQDAIKIGIADILDELQIPQSEKDKLKCALINMAEENLDNLRDVDKTKAKESILQGIERIITESAIPEEKKMEMTKNLKKMATDNLKEPFSDDVQDAMKISIADTLDKQQIPKSGKEKLKRALINMADETLAKLREAKQPLEEVDETKARRSILQGIENICEKSAIPEEKKMKLKRKLKKMVVDNLKKPFNNDVQDAIKIGIADILDELQIPKSEKDKLKRALINMTDDYLENFREEKQPVEEVDGNKTKESILQGIENISEESAIPEEKKMKLKRKLKKIVVDNLKMPFSNDVQDAIKIGISDILDELQIPKSEKDKLKRALINMAEENLDNLRDVDKTKAKESILQGIERIITESAIPEEKKMELKKKLKKMATDNLNKPFSDDVQDAIKIGIADTLDEQQISKSEKDKLKRALINLTDDNVANLRETKQLKPSKGPMPTEEVDENNAKESFLQGIDKIIEESAIPENKMMALKKKLKKITADNLKKPFTDDVHDAIKFGIPDILDELQIPNSEKNKLKRELLNVVDENINNLRGVTPKLSSQVDDFKELESGTQNNILLGFENAIDEAPIPIDKKKELKKKLKDMITKNFQKSLSDNTAAALNDGIYEILDELNLPKDKKNKLKSELTAVVDENLSNFKNEINLAKSMPDAKRNKLNVIIRRVLPQFDKAVDPSYQKQLAEEFDELLEIAGTDGDFKDIRRKLIKKLMREQNLSEKEASAPVDELIDRAREMALKEDMGDERYELDPTYVKTLEADINQLVSIAQVGGDFEETRKKLTKKLMREQNLPEEKASACVDELIGKAQKLALAAQSKDKTTKHKEALAKAISDAVDKSTLSKPDKNSLKNKLLSKLKQTMDNKPFINKDDLEPLKCGVLKALKKIVDASSIPANEKNELKSLLNEELANTIDAIMNEYDVEEGYTKQYTKAISKAVNKSPIPNLQKLNLKKALANIFDGAMDDDDDDKITKHKEPLGELAAQSILQKEALAKAINSAVDQSTLSEPDKSCLKNKLLNKMKQTVDDSPHINDTGALKAEVLKDCKNLVDASSNPTGKKNELKLLLEEEIIGDNEEDKLKNYKEIFAGAINDAVNQSTLSEPDKSDLKNKLLTKMKQTVDDSPHINDTGALKAEVLKDCKNLVDTSSIPTGKKNELKLLLEEEIIGDDQKDKLKKYKEAFAGAINDAVNQCTLSNADKSNQKNKLLSKLNQTMDNSPHLNDLAALTAEVLKDSKKVVDTSSIPIDKKTELKLLLEKEMTEAAKELMNDETVSREAFAIFKDKLTETVKTWMDNLPIDLDSKVATAAAKEIASDILDRQKYLQLHPEAISTDKDEIENLKYQIFRRMKSLVNSKDIPPFIEGTEELYGMIMEIEPPPGFPKLREQCTSGRRRRDRVPQDIDKKNSTSTALSTGNINYSLKELIETSKSIRKHWSRNLEEAITKLPLPTNEKSFMKEKLAIYDETGQINMLSTKNKHKEETSTVQVTKSKKHVAPKPAQVTTKVAQTAPKATKKNNKEKPSSRFSKTEKALTFTNTTKQKSPFAPKSNKSGDVKEFTKFTTDTINAWLDRVQVNVEPDVKKIIVEELTNDIVHRKIFLQIYGNAEPSQSDNLENLKLQVHRRLNEFMPVEALKAVIVDTKELLTKIDTFKIKFTSESAKETKSPVSQKTDRKQGIADILDVKGKATNTSMNGNEEEMEQELSNTEFSPGQTSTPGKPNGEPTAKDIKTNVVESIRTWIETVPIDLEPEAKKDFIDELTNDIVDRKKYLQVQPDKAVSNKEEIENLRFQVFKRLIKADPDASETPDIEKVEKLYKMIGGGRRKSLTPKQTEEFITALNEEVSGILDDYYVGCDRRELHPSLVNELKKLGKSNADQDEIVENLIVTIKRLTYLSACLCDEEAEELAHKLFYRTKKLIARIQEKDRQNSPVKKKDYKEAKMKDTGDVFDGCPMLKEKRKLMESQLAEEHAKDLGIPIEDSDVAMDETGPESKTEHYGMSFNGLTNFIDTWLSSIYTDDNTKEEDEIKDMTYSLIHKIGEMNVDPEIFNDDSLYEAVLRDELQNLLDDVKISDDEFQALIEKVLEAQHRAHDEIAGQTYKRNLRDTISKLLPEQWNLSKEEQATIETLKDRLADAYIDLHYSGDNENQRERLKRKIADEINNFCRDYLYRNPCSPLNSRTLNNNLYTALNKVPLPSGDSIRYEVEQARIREEINDWIKELPLQPQNPTEIFARNKLVYVLSKKLFDIEVEGDDKDNELMKKEIVKFLNKMPLKSGKNNHILADKLIDKLKASEESRKYDADSNVTIDAFGNASAASSGSGMDAPICPAYKDWATPGPSGSPKVCKQPCPTQPKPYPPCTLSPEDRAHLERIKRRTCLSPSRVGSYVRNNKCDVGVGPRSVDAGSQTLLRPFGMEKQQSPICPGNNAKTPRPYPGLSANLEHPPYSRARRDPFEIEKPPPSPICPAAHEKTSRPYPAGPSRSPLQSGHQMRRHTISSSNIESPRPDIQPQVIIKQYYWNPNDKNSIVDESDLQKSGRSSRRQTGSAPCDQTRTSSYAQSNPAPYQRPGLDKLQQQNTNPQRIPCDQSFTCPEPTSQYQPSPERYPHWDTQRSFQGPSQRDIPSPRSSNTPSPCMSPFGLNQQSSPPYCPGFPKRDQEYRMPKRDGLQEQTPCSSRPCRKERVIELGSLDDTSNARPKKRHSDQSDWPYTKFEEDNFWGVPMRRVILDEGIDESVVMEREQREERIRCRCKERLIPKSGRSQPRTCPDQETPQDNEDEQNLEGCSKCCGRQCPYPSFLYFRQ